MTRIICRSLLVLFAVVIVPGTIISADGGSFPELKGAYFGQRPPGVVPEPFADGILNPPEGYHSSIVFSPDGTEAFWTGMAEGTLYSHQENGVWTEPVSFSADTEYGIGEPMFSHDGSRLYFLMRKPPSEGEPARERIWFMDWDKSGTYKPKVIDRTVADVVTHWQFSLAANGNLYLAVERNGVEGSRGIAVARWTEGKFLGPIELGSNINTEVRNFCPFVAPDESYLIFSRSVPEENNRSDLFISFRGSDGKWLDPVNMGDTINSLHNEVCPVVTPDGKYLFFCRISGSENQVYWVSSEVIDRFRSR